MLKIIINEKNENFLCPCFSAFPPPSWQASFVSKERKAFIIAEVGT